MKTIWRATSAAPHIQAAEDERVDADKVAPDNSGARKRSLSQLAKPAIYSYRPEPPSRRFLARITVISDWMADSGTPRAVAGPEEVVGAVQAWLRGIISGEPEPPS